MGFIGQGAVGPGRVRLVRRIETRKSPGRATPGPTFWRNVSPRRHPGATSGGCLRQLYNRTPRTWRLVLRALRIQAWNEGSAASLAPARGPRWGPLPHPKAASSAFKQENGLGEITSCIWPQGVRTRGLSFPNLHGPLPGAGQRWEWKLEETQRPFIHRQGQVRLVCSHSCQPLAWDSSRGGRRHFKPLKRAQEVALETGLTCSKVRSLAPLFLMGRRGATESEARNAPQGTPQRTSS